MALLGGAGSSDGGLDALANLAAALSDPAKLKAAIGEYKTAKTVAEAAQAAATKAAAAADAKVAAMKTERTALDAKSAEVTKIAEANTARTKQLDAAQGALTAETTAFGIEKATFTKTVTSELASIESEKRALETRLANAEAALSDRAGRLKAGEDALAAARAKYDIDKGALDERVRKITQAVA